MISDLKYALRQLIKSPGFTLFAVLTLALGIGANTAIFSVINSVLLSTLPVKDPQQLVFLTDPNSQGFHDGINPGIRQVMTYPEFQYLRDHNNVFSGILAANSSARRLNVLVGGEAQAGADDHAIVSLVSGEYFSVLGVDPVLGRTFTTDADKVRDANPVAVVSYRYWQNRLGGDSAVLGRKIRIGATFYDIIGVAPPSFSGETVGSTPDVWVPLSMQREVIPGSDFLSFGSLGGSTPQWLQVIGRLKPGITVAQANASIKVTFHQCLEYELGAFPGIPQTQKGVFLKQDIVLTEGRHGGSTLRSWYSAPLTFLMILVGLLLLIACANVANLLLARAAARQKEIAIRIAVGAKATRMFRQFLTESVFLSSLGGVAGLLFAQWGISVLVRLAGQSIDVHLDGRVLLFTLGISLLVGVLFGAAPALQAARLDLNVVLKGTAGSMARGGRLSFGKILVVAQVALSLLLLIVAGLFVHSFQKLTTVELGYDHDHLLLFDIDAKASGYQGPGIGQLYQKLSDRIRAVPGVRAVSFSVNGPFGSWSSNGPIAIEGYKPSSGQNLSASYDQVGPNYFTAVGIPLLLGREIEPQDAGSGQRYGVINQTMAKYYFGEANPIGRRIVVSPNSPPPRSFIVVGVVADAKYNNVKEITPRFFYVPFYNPLFDGIQVTFLVRAGGSPSNLMGAVRTAVKQAAPNLPAIEITTMDRKADSQLGLDRLLTKLSGCLAVLAAVLASIGIYGIMSYAVARRTREIGLRMALGAQYGSVLWLVLSESLLMALIGVGVGVPAAIGAGKLISSLLFGLAPADPTVLGAAVGLMFLVSFLAGYLPARRAARVSPLVALRTE